MTTRNIVGLDQAIAHNRAVAESARQRQEALRKDRQKTTEQADADEAAALLVARAIRQRAHDTLSVIDEELDQVDFIVGGTPAPAEEPPVEVTTPDHEPASAPTAPAEEGANDPAPEPVTVPENDEPEPAPAEEDVVVHASPIEYVRHIWIVSPWWARILIVLAALLGAVVFLLIAKVVLTPIIEWGTENWWWWATATALSIWQAGMVFGGIGLGGWLAARFFERHPA